MNRWDIQQNALVVGCEEMRGPIVCPKPRRVGFLASNLTMSLIWQRSGPEAEMCDSKAGAELLDVILLKEGYGREEQSSPPFFCGSPPTRVSNPIVQDSKFGDKNLSPFSTLQRTYPSSSASPSPSPSPLPSPSPSPSPSSMKAGCIRMKFGLKPAAVRIEGFDCLSRDLQGSSISAMA